MAITQLDMTAEERTARGRGIGKQILRFIGLVWYGTAVLILISSIVKGGLAPYESTKDGFLKLFEGLSYFAGGLVFWWLATAFARAFLRMEPEEFLIFFVRLFFPRYRRDQLL